MHSFQTYFLYFFFLFLYAKHCIAVLFITSPVLNTVCVGGKPCPVSWTDNQADNAPSINTYGPTTIGLFTGTQTQQSEIYRLAIVDPGKLDKTMVNIPANVAPDGNEYFIRLDPIKPPGGNVSLYQAFSARFTLSGMTRSAPAGTAGSRLATTGGTNPNSNVSLTSNSTATKSATTLPTSTALPSPTSSASSAQQSSSVSGKYEEMKSGIAKCKAGIILIYLLFAWFSS
ncbi:hypothetical protein O181_064092 [Austropuccinia psidii MF-1]|uniref:Uncharacterized protein n=1 Tax=Austropuccinia psidii MF-1 TaxID=1389203 RepID=A0A9Q3EQU7_9BASI|nr:hypothetical protein [Austropuccinia psidii MF-1]